MHFRKRSEEISILEAVDNLSHMAELDRPFADEEAKMATLTEEEAGERIQSLSWRDPEYDGYNQERVKESFRILLKYMQELYERDKGHLRDEQTQRGIQAVMMLAHEAAQKIDDYTEIFKKTGESAVDLKEFKDLQQYYQTNVLQRYQTLPEVEELWSAEWGAETGEQQQDLLRRGLRDLDAVRNDHGYELFLIRKEDGRPFFDRSLLQHMQLVGQFDGLFNEEKREDMFLRIEMIRDRDAHLAAKEILHLAAPNIDAFYKDAMKHKKIPFVASVGNALMALMLAANTRNLMQSATGKYALKYYADFHHYLRLAVSLPEYKRLMSTPIDKSEPFLQIVLSLLHVLLTGYFLRIGSRQDMSAFIHVLIKKGEKGSEAQSGTGSPVSFWNTLIDDDESLRYYMRAYPNGPVMKALDLFKEGFELGGYDPLRQQNLPGQLFAMVSDEMHVSCIKLPSPTVQKAIIKAEPAIEFEGFIHAQGSQKRNQRHLLINLQDRTTWTEHARCTALEELQKTAGITSTLMVATFPMHTEFYLQTGSYSTQIDAETFIKQLKDQVASAEECGYYFPEKITGKELKAFSEQAIRGIYTLFFGEKGTLTHKNRLDFIEIFYLLLTLKCIEVFRPDTLSFTCKDALDHGASAGAELFSFLRMMNDPAPFSKGEKAFIQWMLYSPALFMRERPISKERFNRAISALSLIHGELEAHRHGIVAGLSKLFKLPFFERMQVKEVRQE